MKTTMNKIVVQESLDVHLYYWYHYEGKPIHNVGKIKPLTSGMVKSLLNLHNIPYDYVTVRRVKE